MNGQNICYQAFEMMKAKKLDEAEKLLKTNLEKSKDPTAQALFYSSLGVLYKIKGDFKGAWRHYEKAEKLIPNDPALKIIVARLLIEHYSQYDGAIKRAKKVLEIIPKNPVFAHQSYITMGLAYCKKSDKKRSIENLEKSWGNDFEGFVTCKNIDFHLVEMLLRKGWGVEICYRFINKALAFAKAHKEQIFIDSFEKMLKAFEHEYPQK